VFVGDGISDYCIAEEEADFVIARSSLKAHCEEIGIEHVPFEDFSDVSRQLEILLAK
jgi:2-hydroxy-3-keto-5-methylthiopentenyl-1-phosphate phosphatase